MGNHLPAQARQAEGVALETARQDGDGDHEQQPIDPLRFSQTAVCQVEHTGFLIAEQLLTAEPLLLAPDPIEIGCQVLIRNHGSPTGKPVGWASTRFTLWLLSAQSRILRKPRHSPRRSCNRRTWQPRCVAVPWISVSPLNRITHPTIPPVEPGG